MALAVGRAIASTGTILVSAVLVVLGSLSATVATDWAKNNLFDVPMKGGDAVYPVLGTVVLLLVRNTRPTRLIGLGMLSSSVAVAAEDYGVI
jgi:hypothetical protein